MATPGNAIILIPCEVLKIKFIHFLMHECFACMYVYAPLYAWYSWRSEEGIGSPEYGATDDCEGSFGGWEPNPHEGPLEEQQMFLPLGHLSWPNILLI